MVNKIHNKPTLKKFRNELRKNLTPAEATLWGMLQNRKLEGRKFRRQHSVGNYILDFYCPDEKLAIELDGEAHFNGFQGEYDLKREQYLNQLGIKVMRFENKIVFENPVELLEEVIEAFGRN